MKRVYQTKFGKTEGNCLAACIASVFGVPIDSVPDFGLTDSWYAKFEEYMIETFSLQPVDLNVDALDDWRPKGYHFISGDSPRGDYKHSLIGFNGEPIHDPFPDGGCELESWDTFTVFIALLEGLW